MKKKLKIGKVEIKSFLTSNENLNSATVKGGTDIIYVTFHCPTIDCPDTNHNCNSIANCFELTSIYATTPCSIESCQTVPINQCNPNSWNSCEIPTIPVNTCV